MKRGLLIREPAQDWARRAYESLLPGAHAAVFGNPRVPQEAEDAGFEVRDCILVIGPVMHHIWLLRRPISEPTVAQQVLKTGTGGLWIDGCRVLTQDNLNGGAYTKGEPPDDPTSWKLFGLTRKAHGEYQQPAGRWPADLVLVHTPECKQEGTKRVKGTAPMGPHPGVTASGVTYGEFKGKPTPVRRTDEEGQETVPSWLCPPTCPVLALDKQSGERPSGGRDALVGDAGSRTWREAEGRSNLVLRASDYKRAASTGGASRFFPQFPSEDALDSWLLLLLLGPGEEEP